MVEDFWIDCLKIKVMVCWDLVFCFGVMEHGTTSISGLRTKCFIAFVKVLAISSEAASNPMIQTTETFAKYKQITITWLPS